MFRLVFSALRVRRTQTVAIFALTVLAALGGSAAPWFLAWAQEAVSAADVRSAPTDQRVVTVTGAAQYRAGDASPVALFRDEVGRALGIEGGTASVGARLYGSMGKTVDQAKGNGAAGLYLGSRAGVCEQLRIEGDCPDARGDVLLSRATAQQLGARIGDEVWISAFRLRDPQHLTVSGIYDVADVLSAYWAGTDLLSGPAGAIATQISASAFVSEETLLSLPVGGIDLDYHLVLPDSAFAGGGVALAQKLRSVNTKLRANSFDLRSSTSVLIDQIRADRQLVAAGVQVAALELVLLSWFCLYLAVRQTSQARRTDTGLLKLRGAAPVRIFALTALQSAVPMLAGVLLGAALGYLGARVLGGEAPSASGTTLLVSALVAVGVGVGSLLAAVVAEWSMLRAPVAGLMRRVPTRRSGWRGNIGDFAVVGLAAAGIYQGYAERDSDSGPSVLSLLAPGLLALAVALLIARLLPVLGSTIGAAAIRAGRAGTALSALNVARRPGTDRVFMVLAVCLGVVATTLFSWQSTNAAWTQRAELELGAPRVVVVKAASSAHLLAAVRAADPEGRYAMAVAVGRGAHDADRVLAVDISRLARVAYLPQSYQLPPADQLAAELHPSLPVLPRVHDGELALDATLSTARPAVSVGVQLERPDGSFTSAILGPLRKGQHTAQVTVSGCGPAGCRLVGFELDTEATQTALTLHALRQEGGDVVTTEVFRDITRWRSPVGPARIGTVLHTGDDGLVLQPYDGAVAPNQASDPRVLAVAAPAPMPVLVAGPRPHPSRAGDSRYTVLGVEAVPYADAARAGMLPRLGSSGALMDLEYARQVTGLADEAVELEVWLTGDAPPQVLEQIRGAGVEILTDRGIDDLTGRFGEHGPGLALRFQVFAALVLLLLAAGTIIVATAVQRRDRAQELRNLRAQGLPERAMRFAGYAANLLVVGGAVVAGLLAAVVAAKLITAALPIFTDGWSVLPRPSSLAPGGLGLVLLAAAVVLLPAAIAGSARVVRAARNGDEA